MDQIFKMGWLSPEGELIECGSYEHVSVARNIAYQRGYSQIDANGKKINPDDQLMQNGWAYIGVSDLDQELRIGWNNWLTNSQKQFLKPYFENEVEWRPINQIAKYRWEQENRI